MFRLRSYYLALTAAAFTIGACGDRTSSDEIEPAATEAPIQGVVDSIFPIEEEIRRFELTVDEEATALTGGADSREKLVAGFIAALEHSDTAALARAVLDRSEFIYLYFPHTVYTAPPYEMDPAIIWFQMTNHSSRGITRAYQRFADQPLNYRGHSCASEPIVEGPNRIWDRCVVRIAPGGEEVSMRLFGLILEHEGHYKFVTYGNDL